MDSSFLKKYALQETERRGLGGLELDSGLDDLGPFGWLRSPRERCPMIEFRKQTGNILALGYAWLNRIEFDPSEGITLWFASQKVILRGQNLNAETRPGVRLLEGLTRHRVPWVCELGRAPVPPSANSCFVEMIEEL